MPSKATKRKPSPAKGKPKAKSKVTKPAKKSSKGAPKAATKRATPPSSKDAKVTTKSSPRAAEGKGAKKTEKAPPSVKAPASVKAPNSAKPAATGPASVKAPASVKGGKAGVPPTQTRGAEPKSTKGSLAAGRPSIKAKAPVPPPKPVIPPPRRRPPPPEPPPKPMSFEERYAILEKRLQQVDPNAMTVYRQQFDMSWIYHDSALEGVVYTPEELRAAIDPSAPLIATDSSLQPICEEIRRHREALDFIRDYATKPKQPITVDVVKRIFLILHPEEGDIKTVRYRKDIPQHRLYFHEYTAPDKIAIKVRQVVDWLNDPETRKARSVLRLAARAHYDLLRIFPFASDSGKVARALMNLLLLRGGIPPAIVHSTERQRYYEALKGASASMTQIVQEAIENNLQSIEKWLDMHERPAPKFATS